MSASNSTILQIQAIQAAFSVLTALNFNSFNCPQQATVQDGATFDYIVVGAGSAGCVIANRLTEIEDVTVLLIEAGGDPPIESTIPGLFPFVKHCSSDWNYASEDDGYSQQFHKNHGAELTRGKMLGGTSAVNFMVYARGNFHDFDNWAELTDDETWNWENVLPYFMKSERLVDPVLIASNASRYHSTDGYLGTTRYYSEEALKYLNAFAELGHDIVLDTNGNTPLGYTETMFSIADGARQSTAEAFLKPIKNRSNLFMLKNTLVSKILFDDNKNAIGVEAILENTTTVNFNAEHEVILSAGSFNTPKLLMLSGVGPAEHLKSHDIDVISDLPVGQAMQDHIIVFATHVMNTTSVSKAVDYVNFPIPLVMGFAALNKSQTYPDYQSFNFLLNDPTLCMQFCSFYFAYVDEICDDLYNHIVDKELLLTAVFLLYPESRGKVLLRSTDPTDAPLVYTGYYSNEEDLNNHARYVQDFMKIYDTEVFNNQSAKLIVPEVCGCGDDSSTLEYWKCYCLCMMVSGYHHASTCPMGDVVDSRLKTYGVQKLRIADASIMPKITGANTNPATIMIGEKAADFIKEDYYSSL